MLKPLFAPLAKTPSARSDEAQAMRYCKGESGVRGGLEDDLAGVLFYFKHADGAVDWYTGFELRQQTWWYWLPERVALSIEAHLFPLARSEPSVHYVARADNRAGGKLIQGSRLSSFFEGAAGREAAYAEWKRLREVHSDAAVFSADSAAQAERYLSAEDAAAEGVADQRRLMAVARAKRFGALLS